MGCDFNTNVRSGTVDDDYIEEPLAGGAEKYEKALETSNTFVEYVKANRIDAIYQNLFSEELRATVSIGDFKEMLGKVNSAAGKIIRYKKMQWSFISYSEEGRDVIGSVKLVEHENEMLKYLLVFDRSGDLTRIIGFHFKQRKGVSPTGHF